MKPPTDVDGRDPAAPRRRVPLVPNGGWRTIKAMTVTLDDGTNIAWSGTGSVSITASSIKKGMDTKPDILYAEAILRYPDPAAMAVGYPDEALREEGGA